MYLKLLISFGFLLLLNFTVTFKDPSVLLQTYTQVFLNLDLPINNRDYGMCKTATSNLIWRATTCQRIFQLLRSNHADANPFRNSLYMNYTALITPNNSVCEMKFINIGIYETASQITMNCYGRLAVDPVSHEDNRHFNEISIMYGLENSIMVFKYLPSTLYHTLFEWYAFTEWYSDQIIPEEILTAPVPQAVGIEWWFEEVFSMSSEDISRMSWNSEHFINTSESAVNLQKYCFVLCKNKRRISKYMIEKINISEYGQSENTSVTLRLYKALLQPFADKININNITFKISNVQTHDCKLFQKAEKNIKIMAGPKPHSVILLELREYREQYYYVPIELIENLTVNYLLNIEIHY